MPSTKKKSSPKSAAGSVKGRVRDAAGDPGEVAYAALRSRLAGIPVERVIQPRTDVRAATTFVLSDTARRLSDPKLVARFDSLPDTEFDHSAVHDLIPAAQAALWAQTQLTVDETSEATPRLPEDLIQQSTALRGDMLDVCAYSFKDDPKLMRQVDAIRAGQGYLDLAQDLSRLSALYTKHHLTLKLDLRFYVATDAQDALALSQRITSELRMQPGTQAAREVAWRTWALTLQLYNEVARGGKFLLGDAGEAAFPPLNSVGRTPSRRQRTKAPADASPPASSPSP